MRKTEFADDCYYHIYNRGVDKRKIFMDESDCARFQQSLFSLNDANAVVMRSIISAEAKPMQTKREQLVDIGAYCLMLNHFHLLIKSKNAGGVAAFMQKLGTSYSMYFNKKHKRTGRLFENVFKASLIDGDEYLRHISIYIHTNPIKLLESHWKEQGIQNIQKAHDFLENYQWSSYPHYLEKKKDDALSLCAFPKYFESGNKYKAFLDDWILHDYTKAKPM